jgi:hypothetical protein
VLAAFGFDAVDRWARSGQVIANRRRAVAIGVGGLLAIGGALLAGELLASWVRAHFGGVAATPAARTYVDQHVRFIVGISAVAVAAAAGVLLLGRNRVARGAALAVVAGAVLAQSAWTFRNYNPTIPAALFYPQSPAAETVRSLTGDQVTLHLQHALVWPDTNLWYRFPDAGSYDAVGIKAYDQLLKETLGNSDSEDTSRPRNIQALRAIGIRFVVTTGDDPLGPPPDALPKVWAEPPLTLFGVPGSPARYFTVGSSEVVASQEQARQRLTARDFDVNRTVLLRGAGARPGVSPVAEGAGATTVVEHESPTSVRLSVHSAAPGWTVFLRSSYPGWKATVNGRDQPLVEANAAFMAVPVPAGTSAITLTYAPASVRTGAILSVAGLLILVGLAGAAVILGRRKPVSG